MGGGGGGGGIAFLTNNSRRRDTYTRTYWNKVGRKMCIYCINIHCVKEMIDVATYLRMQVILHMAVLNPKYSIQYTTVA